MKIVSIVKGKSTVREVRVPIAIPLYWSRALQ